MRVHTHCAPMRTNIQVAKIGKTFSFFAITAVKNQSLQCSVWSVGLTAEDFDQFLSWTFGVYTNRYNLVSEVHHRKVIPIE